MSKSDGYSAVNGTTSAIHTGTAGGDNGNQQQQHGRSSYRSHPVNKPLNVLFLSSDTGGGHRASAEALGAQFESLYPGSKYTLLDIVKEHSHAPYNRLVESYKHLSAHPYQWAILYRISNTHTLSSFVKTHLKITTERSVRKRILGMDPMPDVVISVHPLMTNVPVMCCRKISCQTGRHLPIFTVVTDLGSGHCTWFDNGVEKMFIASKMIEDLAVSRGNVPKDKLVMTGLPIRKDFALQAKMLGITRTNGSATSGSDINSSGATSDSSHGNEHKNNDECNEESIKTKTFCTTGGRNSLQGKIYQMHVREMLGLGNSPASHHGHHTHDDDSTNEHKLNNDIFMPLDIDMDMLQNSMNNTNMNHNMNKPERKIILVMGGGEGVGSLSSIVDALYVQLAKENIVATIVVVCGRNEKLKHELEMKDWDAFLNTQKEKTLPRRLSRLRIPISRKSSQRRGLEDGNSKSSAIANNDANGTGTSNGDQNGATRIGNIDAQQQQDDQEQQLRSEQKFGLVRGIVTLPLRVLKSSTSKIPGFSSPSTCGDCSNICASVEVTAMAMNEKAEEEEEEKAVVQRLMKVDQDVRIGQEKDARMCYESHHDSGTYEEEKKGPDERIVPSTQRNINTPPETTTKSETYQKVQRYDEGYEQDESVSESVKVHPLGFVTNMAEYMVAADVLVTKAGPGTIAEAASVGLPVMLTSFLPGQEEGNVDFVLEKKFGSYQPDSKPSSIATTVCSWLKNPHELADLSRHAQEAGVPDAAEDIVRTIGTSVLRWKELHPEEEAKGVVPGGAMDSEIMEGEEKVGLEEEEGVEVVRHHLIDRSVPQVSC